MQNTPNISVNKDQEAFLQQKKPLDPRIQQKLVTQNRHNSMFGKTISLKLQSNKISTSQLQNLNLAFTEANYFYNHCIHSLPHIKSVDSTLKIVPVYAKDGSFVKREFVILSSQMKQAIKDRIFANQKALKTSNSKVNPNFKPKQTEPKSKTQLKKQGNRKPERHGKASIGSMKFKTECNSIPLKQYSITYKLDTANSTVKIQNIKGWFHVNGTKQIPKDAELCNATISRHNGSFYLNIYCYIPKKPKNDTIQQTQVPEGIDFGCSIPITTSSGLKFEFNLPVNKQIKHITRKCFKRKNKKTKIHTRGLGNKRIKNRGGRPNSNNKTKDLAKRRKLYEKLENRRTDCRNKIVSYLTARFAIIVMQDDCIKGWQAGGHGKKVSGTGIGGIKTALRNKAVTSVMISQKYPSTKTCSNCGCIQKMKLSDRIYVCKVCHFECCRDINGARTIRDEGLRLREKTVIQMNGVNTYHCLNEKDTIRESNRIKSLEKTKEWMLDLQDKLQQQKNQQADFSVVEGIEEHGTCGEHETMLSKHVKVSKGTLTCFEGKKPEEKTTAGFLVVRESLDKFPKGNKTSCLSTTQEAPLL